MNYKKIYDNLIAKRRRNPLTKVGDGTIERHHIIPKSYGGTDDPSNTINLTLREHFVAHLLLYHDAINSNERALAGKMACALYRFMSRRHDFFNSHVYENLKMRKDVGIFWKGKNHKKSSREKTRKKMTPENSTNPRIWVCKDGVVKYIRKELLNEYIANGFELGR